MIHTQQHAVYSCKWDQESQSLGRIDLLRGLDPQQHAPFSPELYSKFKYGSSAASQHYALDIYRTVQLLFANELEADATNLVLTSAAYKSMPTASTALFAHALALINDERRMKDLAVIPDIKIHRKSILNKDYGMLTHEARAKAMQCTQLDIVLADHPESESTSVTNLRGKHIVIIDDCIITGAHMNCVTNHFRNNIPGLREGDDVQLTFLFILSVQSNTTATPDRSTTAAENHLNHYYVTSLDRWSEMVNSDDAGPVNGRMVKYFLTSNTSMENKVAILGQLRHEAVLQMYRGAIADDIASSFTEQMEAIERQIGINDDRMKEKGCCCRDHSSSITTTTTTTTTTNTLHLMRKVSEETLEDGTAHK
jgi:hypothetical protein